MKLDTLVRYPITPGPWSAEGTVLRNAKGQSIASAGNNRAVVGEVLGASLKVAAAAPELLQIALWAEAAFGFLAATASTPEDRAVFKSRFLDTCVTLNAIRS